MTAVTFDQAPVEQDMKKAFSFSVLFHALLIAIAVLGLPFMTPHLPVIDTSIDIELVDSAEAEKMDREQKNERERQPEQKKDEPPKPVMPQVTAKTPPKPVAPTPPEKSEMAPPEEQATVPVKKPEPEPKKAPPKPVQRPVLTQTEEPEQDEQFKSLLRNLMPTEEDPVKSDTPRTGEQSALSQMAAAMNVGELQALKAQLTQCWSLMAGARYAEDLVVDIRLFMNPDRTIRDAKIENQLRYNTDSFFRAAADSALRAVYRCSPLDLPPNKYDQWKTMVVTFDPRTML